MNRMSRQLLLVLGRNQPLMDAGLLLNRHLFGSL